MIAEVPNTVSKLCAIELPAVSIPQSALTFRGFCQWACSDAFPEKTKICLIGKEIIVDMNPEKADSHVSVKQAIYRTMSQLIEEQDMGLFFPDGLLIVHEAAELSNMPDASLISRESIRDGRIKRIPDEFGDDCSALEGSADWVLEIISQSSVQKDTVLLRQKYFRAGVVEYWIVDARKTDQTDLQILVRGKRGFVAQPRVGGWSNSPLFGRRFSLQRRTYEGDFWRFELLVASSAR